MSGIVVPQGMLVRINLATAALLSQVRSNPGPCHHPVRRKNRMGKITRLRIKANKKYNTHTNAIKIYHSMQTTGQKQDRKNAKCKPAVKTKKLSRSFGARL